MPDIELAHYVASLGRKNLRVVRFLFVLRLILSVLALAGAIYGLFFAPFLRIESTVAGDTVTNSFVLFDFGRDVKGFFAAVRYASSIVILSVINLVLSIIRSKRIIKNWSYWFYKNDNGLRRKLFLLLLVFLSAFAMIALAVSGFKLAKQNEWEGFAGVVGSDPKVIAGFGFVAFMGASVFIVWCCQLSNRINQLMWKKYDLTCDFGHAWK